MRAAKRRQSELPLCFGKLACEQERRQMARRDEGLIGTVAVVVVLVLTDGHYAVCAGGAAVKQNRKPARVSQSCRRLAHKRPFKSRGSLSPAFGQRNGRDS